MLWNLFKTKIRRVELSPTVHKFGRCFDTKNSIYGVWSFWFSHEQCIVNKLFRVPWQFRKKRKETKMLQTCMTSISRSLVGKSNPSMETSTRVRFKSPDSATAWGLPGCHSPRHAPEKGQGVFWDQSWCWWWGRSVIYFMTWQQVLPIFFGSMQEVSLQVPGLFSIATPNDLEEILRFFVRLDR